MGIRNVAAPDALMMGEVIVTDLYGKGRHAYVVTQAGYAGGGHGHGDGDEYPNGWQVILSPLRPYRTFDASAPTVARYQSGSFNADVMMPAFEREGRMRRVISFV